MKHGFKLIDKTFSKDLNSDLYEFEHVRSGARLAAIVNDDTNKVFQIAFRTPSENSTGVAHILEHSTLCGSRKYPVKEPFVELAKGSINTFLNAMTYPDKTVYPIATTNDKDFRNLEDVYLDAVFYPNVYKNPYTFMQEGWHYHLEDKDAPLYYNGVVYNEMKGVFSSPDAVLDRHTYAALFPDSIYGGESGGDPDCIPELTYEAFLDFHKRLYHPSNAYIYLYGNIDLDEQLAYLDGWLSAFERQAPGSDIALQPAPAGRVYGEYPYPVSEIKAGEDQDYLSLNYVMKPGATAEEVAALQVLGYVLLDANASVLKKALLEKNLAKEISYAFSTPLAQPVFTIELKETDKDKKDVFVQTVQDVLTDLAENGINPEDLQAAINLSEFKTLEVLNGETGTTPKGLLLGLGMLEGWLYGEKPFERLNFTEQFEALEAMRKNGGFEKLIREVFLDNPHQALIALYPDEHMGETREKAFAEKLKAYKESLSEAERDALIEQTQALIAYQNAEDTPENLKTIPRLQVSEIEKKAPIITYETLELDGVPVIYHDEDTNGIVYLKLFFDAHVLSAQDIPYLSVLNKLTGLISSRALSYETINRNTDLYTGGITSSINTDEKVDHSGIIAQFIVKTRARLDRINETCGLLKAVTTEAIYTEKELIHDIIREARISKRERIQRNGHTASAQRMQAYYSEQARLFEEVGGIEFYRFLCDLDDHFDERWPELSARLQKTAQTIFSKNALTLSVTCARDALPKVFEALRPVIADFGSAPVQSEAFAFAPLTKNEAFITPGNVMYNSVGGNFSDDYTYSGALQVLRTMLSMGYLWNKVRVRGGAYGAFFGVNSMGDLYMSSYRDPNLEGTYAAYDSVPDYVKALDLGQDEIDKYIIGTISAKDVPLSPTMRSSIGDGMYFRGTTNERRQKERDEILGTDLSALKDSAALIRDALDQDYFCTIGTETDIEKNRDKFEKVDYLK